MSRNHKEGENIYSHTVTIIMLEIYQVHTRINLLPELTVTLEE